MASKFCGEVGYADGSVEVRPGIVEESIVEYLYFGDVVRNTRQLESGEKINNDISVGNSISIVADAYANEHFFAMRYIKWAGVFWVVSSVEVRSPRLILQLGGVYNGPKARTADPS